MALRNNEIFKQNNNVSLAKKGNKEAFITLIQENKVNLYRVAKAMLYNETDVEDAIQIAIMNAFEHVKSLKKNEYFRTWLIRILINQCNAIIKEKKKVVSFEQIDLVAYEDSYTDLDLLSAVFSMKEEFRVVTVLFYYEDLSVKEIASMLHIPEGTVKSRLANARTLLQNLLKRDESE